MNRIPEEKEKRVITLWFEGKSTDEIALLLHISKSTVSRIVHLLPPTIAPLRELSKELKKMGKTAIELLPAATLLERLIELGIRTEEVPDFIEFAKKSAEDHNYNFSTIVQAGIKAIQIERKTGKSYAEAIETFFHEAKRYHKLTQENLALESLVKQNKQEEKESYKKANFTKVQIEKILELKTKLESQGIKLKEIEKLTLFIDNARKSGYRPQAFFNLATKFGVIQEQIDLGVKTLQKLKNEINTKRSEKIALEKSLQPLRQVHQGMIAQGRQIAKNNKILIEQENELQSRTNTLTNQHYQIENSLAEQEIVRIVLINEIAKMRGLNENQTRDLQMQQSYHLLSKVLVLKMLVALKLL